MIGFLQGTFRDGVVLTTGGVGYAVAVAGSIDDGAAVELHVHTVVREDAISLYGFVDPIDRDAFGALLKVNGVGPQAALAVVRDAGAARLAAAVAAGDASLLGKVKGLGPKLTARVVADVVLPEGVEPVEVDELGELIDTLERLGFDRAAAERAARAAKEASPAGDESAWLAGALGELRAG